MPLPWQRHIECLGDAKTAGHSSTNRRFWCRGGTDLSTPLGVHLLLPWKVSRFFSSSIQDVRSPSIQSVPSHRHLRQFSRYIELLHSREDLVSQSLHIPDATLLRNIRIHLSPQLQPIPFCSRPAFPPYLAPGSSQYCRCSRPSKSLRLSNGYLKTDLPVLYLRFREIREAFICSLRTARFLFREALWVNELQSFSLHIKCRVQCIFSFSDRFSKARIESI